ncbi:hypothetical protein [Roseomonas gilardii]|uniref:hypothetical protein n=1 Tax=Roseomonas gilardii TaxID=257708 RepID=UPI0011C05C68|nr:hypothetical protein [Roseomonas gilardii]
MTYDDISAALSAGFLASATNIGGKVLNDLYDAAKKLIIRKSNQAENISVAISELEKKPESSPRRAVLSEEMATAGLEIDTELLAVIERLQSAIENLSAAGSLNSQNAVGSNIAQASGGSRASVNINNTNGYVGTKKN